MFERRISEPWHGTDGREYALALNEKGATVIVVNAPAAGWTELAPLTLTDGYEVTDALADVASPAPPQNEEIPAGDGRETPTGLGPDPGSVAGE